MFKRFVLASLASLAFAGCNGQQPSTAAAQPAKIEPASQPSAPAPQIPDHFYSVKDGYQYGYRGEISDAERQQGQAAPEIQMFTFHGLNNGVYQAVQKLSDRDAVVVDCKAPCSLIHVRQMWVTGYGSLHLVAEKYLDSDTKTIAGELMADASSGKLKVVPNPDGKPERHWFADDRGRIHWVKDVDGTANN